MRFIRGRFKAFKISVTRFWDLLFGFDYFIAHRSLDGKSYAQALHDRLIQMPNPFRSFIDGRDYSLGGDLSLMQTRALARTTRLVVIVTPAAHAPLTKNKDWLLGEVREFKSRRKDKAIIVPIGTRRTLDPAAFPASSLLGEIPCYPDSNCVLEDDESCLLHAPSDETVARLILDFRERRQEQLRLRIFQALTVGLALLLMTTIGLGIAAHLQRQLALRNEQRARVSKSAAEGIVDDMLGSLKTKLEAIGKLELLEDVSRAAEDYFANMDQDLRDHETELHAALTYLSRGDILRQKGDHERATEAYTRAESKLAVLARTASQSAKTCGYLSNVRGALAMMSGLNSNPPEQEAWLEKSRVAIDEALRLAPQDQQYRRDQLTVRANQLSSASIRSLPTTAAEWDTIIQSASQLARESPNALNVRLVSFICATAGEIDEERGETEKALSRQKLACELIFELRDRLGDDAVVQLDLADSLMRLGLIEKKLGRMKDAASTLQASENITRSLRTGDPVNQEWLGMDAELLSELSDVLFANGNKDEAIQDAGESAKILGGIYDRNPRGRYHAQIAALVLGSFGFKLAAGGDWGHARAAWKQASDALERLTSFGDLTPEEEISVAIMNRYLAEGALSETPPDIRQAHDYLKKALARLRKLQDSSRLPPAAESFIGKWEKRLYELDFKEQ